MNVEILRQSGIDYDKGVKRFVGRAHLFEKSLCKFSKDVTFSRIRAAYEANDREQLFAAAHEFKGMCGNIALTSLYEASDEIVRLLRSGECTDAELCAAYGRLDKEYQLVYGAVVAAMEESV